jgi:hypothetical protein
MTKKQIDFLNMVAPVAVVQAANHGSALFPSVTIAQAIHESGWGTSAKMVNANALYGVKVGKSAYKFGTAWKGAAYKTGTTEYYDGKNPTRIVDWFRAYANIADATEDYMDMLCHCQRYKAALNRKTPQESISAIVSGGYATGPDYARHIMDIINGANLTIFDRQGFSPVWVVGKVYTTQQDLNVREEPNGIKRPYEALTDNAKLHAIMGTSGEGILKRGTRVTVYEIKPIGQAVWLRIPSGWICGRNSKNIFVL